jgi:hypothetical protein
MPWKCGISSERHSPFIFGNLDISVDDLTVPGKVIQLGYEPNRIDLMTSVTGVSFDEAGYQSISLGERLSFATKESTGRAKDRIDAEELRQTRAIANDKSHGWRVRL